MRISSPDNINHDHYAYIIGELKISKERNINIETIESTNNHIRAHIDKQCYVQELKCNK